MNLKLKKITMDNFEECINLKVDPSQKKFVAINMYSLAEAKVDEVSIPLAIYTENEMVGFVMYDYAPKENKAYISRLMTDAKYQGKGYGRWAMEEVIRRICLIDDCKHIQTSFEPSNVVASKLYLSLGFIETGEIDEGEVVCMREI